MDCLLVPLPLCRHSALVVLGLMQCSGCAGAPVTLGLNPCQENRAGDPIQLRRACMPSRAVPSKSANGKVFSFLMVCMGVLLLQVPWFCRQWKGPCLDVAV